MRHHDEEMHGTILHEAKTLFFASCCLLLFFLSFCEIGITLHGLSAAFSGADLNQKSGLNMVQQRLRICSTGRREVQREVEIERDGGKVKPRMCSSSNGVWYGQGGSHISNLVSQRG